MRHSKRTKLSVEDINAALRVKNVEVSFAFCILSMFIHYSLLATLWIYMRRSTQV